MAMASEGSSGLNISALRITSQSSIALDPVDKNMEKIMECPVCHEIPLPPIYTCKTGHFTCETCQKKIKKVSDECPICKSSFTTSRNYALESIIQTSKFYCNHRQNLCTFTGTIDELKIHHDSCAFRSIKCHRTGQEGCTGVELYLPQYVQHLKNAHGIGYRENRTDSRPNVFVDRFTTTYWEDGTSPRDANYGITKLINYNNEVFTSYAFTRGSTFYFGLYLIGSETSASKYAAKITIKKNCGNTVFKLELTTPMPSIREISKGSDGVLPSVALHKDLMQKLGTFVPLQQNLKRQLSLKVMYEIIILKLKQGAKPLV